MAVGNIWTYGGDEEIMVGVLDQTKLIDDIVCFVIRDVVSEDMVEVIAIDYGYGQDPDLDELVPQDLAELLCNNNCVVVAEYTPIEPDAFERKYYAPGIGFFLGTTPDEDD